MIRILRANELRANETRVDRASPGDVARSVDDHAAVGERRQLDAAVHRGAYEMLGALHVRARGQTIRQPFQVEGIRPADLHRVAAAEACRRIPRRATEELE